MITGAGILTGSDLITTSAAPIFGKINRYDATDSPLLPNLPPVVSANVGSRMIVEKTDTTTNTVTFTCTGSDTFADGSTTLILQLETYQFELQIISISGTKVWHAFGIPLSDFDNRYLPQTNDTNTLSTSVAPTINKLNIYITTDGMLTPSLPALSGLNVGSVYPIQKSSLDQNLNTVTFTPAGADTFDDGTVSRILRLPGELRVLQVVTVSAAKKWKVVGGNTPLGSLDTRYRGTVAAGVKGGKTTLLHRRDISSADLLSPWYGQITTAVTNTGVTTMTSPTTNAMSATPSWCTPLGGTLVALPAFTPAFMFNWRSPNGGAIATPTFPWPSVTTIEFSLDTSTLGAFEVSFRPTVASASFFYNLWIDGRRVWDVPQTATVTQNASNNYLKFTGLPSGVHRYRMSLNSSAIWQVFTPQNTLPLPVPAKGPRLFFLGDSLESIGGAAGSSGVHTGIEMGAWPWRFAEMIGCNDVWLGGEGSTGFIANASGGRTVTDGSILASVDATRKTLTSATATFVSGDVGTKVQIIGAGVGGAISVLSAMIASRTNGTTVVLDTAASQDVTGAWTQIGGTAANYPIRAITDIIPAAPDIVFIDSYHNDTSFTAAQIAASLTLTLTAIQSALPNTMIIVTGGFDSTGVGGSLYTTIDAALLAVCTAHGVPYVAPANTGTVYDGAGNVVAVQGPWIDTHTVNLYIESDGTHPTDAGMKYLPHRKTQSVLALLPA